MAQGLLKVEALVPEELVVKLDCPSAKFAAANEIVGIVFHTRTRLLL
jgi:hypothetical protein